MTLNRGIVTLTFFIIIFSLLIAGVFIIGSIINSTERKLEAQSMLVAQTVAKLPEVTTILHKENLSLKKQATTMNIVIEPIRSVNDAEYIVVTNMEHQRLSHPIPSRLTTIESSSIEEAAYSEHYYNEKVKGELGTMIRAFVPIMDMNYQQIGVVTVGYLLPTVGEILNNMKSEIFLATILSLGFGFWGAVLLSNRIKKQIHDYEPYEIARLYTERIETFNAMQDGIIAIDNDFIITIFNPRAKEILGIETDDIIGKCIEELLPDTRLPEILDYNQPIYNKELYINKHTILSNRVPIEVDGEIIGAIAIFKDQTEAKQLAEELTGVKEFVQALRIQNHEHKNKMHTIAGLIQLGHHQQALDYIVDIQGEEQELTQFLNKRIRNQNIAGLILSKINRGKELGINVEIDEQSILEQLPEQLDFHDFVILVGNLVENAFDALQLSMNEEKELFISIDQNKEILTLLIEDNGIGMTDAQIARIFDNGYTTKNSVEHGVGLHLIQGILQKSNGVIEITSSPNEGTSIYVTFNMFREEQ